MSLNEIRRRRLPPDLRSSFTIFCVFGRAFGRLGMTAPALKDKSIKKDSLWEANFFKAFSKSVSFKPPPAPVPFTCNALIVMLLRLLAVPFVLGDSCKVDIDRRASSERLESRWYEFLLVL